MTDSDLTEFEIEEKELKLRIVRSDGRAPMMAAAPAIAAAPEAVAASATATAAPDDGGLVIKSPMVGTFYRAPNPDSPPFVENGSKVTGDTVVCIIEAMKVMNEIQAECSGKILEVLVENGEPVEYGQPLFTIEKA